MRRAGRLAAVLSFLLAAVVAPAALPIYLLAGDRPRFAAAAIAWFLPTVSLVAAVTRPRIRARLTAVHGDAPLGCEMLIALSGVGGATWLTASLWQASDLAGTVAAIILFLTLGGFFLAAASDPADCPVPPAEDGVGNPTPRGAGVTSPSGEPDRN